MKSETENKLFEIMHHFDKTIDKPEYDKNLIQIKSIHQVFNKDRHPKKMRENQRKIFNKYINSIRLSISEPPGAGKSLTIAFAMAWRVMNWPNHKIIIIVPQTVGSKSFGKEILKYDDETIFHWDIYNNLCSTSENQKVKMVIDFLHRRHFTKNPNERILITTHAAMARVFSQIKYSDELFINTSFVIDEAHHIMYTKAEDEDNFVTNQIGELIRSINGNQNCSIWLATATPFRGDRNSIIPKEQMKTFDIHFLPLDKHWAENIEHIKSFEFDFVMFKDGGIFEAIKTIIKNKKKTIIFCPYKGDLIKESDKYTFRDEIISNILSVWPECQIMDLIEESGRESVKKKLFDNKTASEFDVILTLKMFDESTDWICAQQCIDLTPSNTLRIMYQRFGRLWRDFLGKYIINYYCFLPFEADFEDDETRREHLSNAYNIFVATLLLQETIDPIPYPAKKQKKPELPKIQDIPIVSEDPVESEEENGPEPDDVIPLDPLSTITDDENEKEELIHDVINKLLIMASHDSDPSFNEVYNWIGTVVDEHEIIEDRDEVIKHIAKILRRLLKKKSYWVSNPIDISWMREAGFDKIWSNDIFGSLLMFSTKTCDIKHFEEFRRVYSEKKSSDEYVKEFEQIEQDNGGIIPFGTLNKLGEAYAYMVRTYPEKFSHLHFETSKSSDEYVKEFEQIEQDNGGIIPWKISTKLGEAYKNIIRKYPEKFKHFHFETRDEMYIKKFEQIEQDNGGIIPFGSLNKQESNYYRYIKIKYPEKFSHLHFETAKFSDEYVKEFEQIEQDNGGIIPWGTLPKLGHKYYHAKSRYPEKFSHLHFETKQEFIRRIKNAT